MNMQANGYIQVLLTCLEVAIIYGLGQAKPEPATSSLFDQRHWVFAQIVSFAWLPFDLFSICLRFDFSIHADAAGSAAVATTLNMSTLPAPATDDQQLGINPGVVAPSYADLAAIRFPCPYFGSALAVWLCANVVIIIQGLRGPANADHGPVKHASGVLILAPICIVITTMAVAFARGETKRLLEYEEVWTYYESGNKAE